MSFRKAKSAPKQFETDRKKLKALVMKEMKRVSDAVGATYGPGGLPALIESDLPGIKNSVTKDGVSVMRSLGAVGAFEHLIIETARDAAERTVTEAGDGTTTATVLSYSIMEQLFKFCEDHPRYSPQKAGRRISEVARKILVPYIEERAIKIDDDNRDLLRAVAKISANGDQELADAVIEAFETVGYGASSHVNIREQNGPSGFKVELIEGLPVPTGFEETSRSQAVRFIEKGSQRVYLKNVRFILYDGAFNDIVQLMPLLELIGDKHGLQIDPHTGELNKKGDPLFENFVLVAHGFSEQVIAMLAANYEGKFSFKVVPLITPMAQFVNSQTQFLHDLGAFTGSKVFGLKDQILNATLEDLGLMMEAFDCGRFRSTILGDSDEVLVEMRADDLRTQLKTAESKAEKSWIEERLAKITNGIAKLTVIGGSSSEIKERVDRVDDAVCSVRAAITRGALPGGGRIAIDMALKLQQELPEGDPALEVLVPALLSLPRRILDNAGRTEEEVQEVLRTLIMDQSMVYDIENEKYGTAEELGLFDSTAAVQESLTNAVSIATTLGMLGAIVAHPRDATFERQEAQMDSEFYRNTSDQS
jgi:chaperonin GroEL